MQPLCCVLTLCMLTTRLRFSVRNNCHYLSLHIQHAKETGIINFHVLVSFHCGSALNFKNGDFACVRVVLEVHRGNDLGQERSEEANLHDFARNWCRCFVFGWYVALLHTAGLCLFRLLLFFQLATHLNLYVLELLQLCWR